MNAGRARLALAVLALCVAAIAFGIGYASRAGRGAAPPAPVAASGPAVATVVARGGEIALTLAASGRVGPPAGSDAKLAFPLAGIVRSVDVRVGDAVSRGQVLATLEDRTFSESAAAAAADAAAAAASYGGGAVSSAVERSAAAKLAVARARLETLQRRGPAALSDRIAAVSAARQAQLKVEADAQALARVRTLYGGGVSAYKDVEAAGQQLAADEADARAASAKVAAAGALFEADLRQARADVALAGSDARAAAAQGGVSAAQAAGAEARADAARHDVERARLRAPDDGIVLAILKHAGEAIDPSSPAIDVGPPVGHDVTLSVSGSDARRMHRGDPVAMVVQERGAGVRGVVAAVVPAVDPSTQTSSVVIRGAPPGALAGDAVSARVTVGRARGVLVPASAVVEDPGTGNTVVFVATGERDRPFEARTVSVLASDAEHAVIGRGVRAGERVAGAGAYDLLAPSG